MTLNSASGAETQLPESSLGRGGGEGGTRAASGSLPEPWLLDSREVARLLGLGRTKVFQMMARDELPVVRIGRCVRVPRAALRDWLETQTAMADAWPGTRGWWPRVGGWSSG